VEGKAARSNVVDELELRAGDEHAETKSFHGPSGSFLSCEWIVVKKAGYIEEQCSTEGRIGFSSRMVAEVFLFR
jgi:hypothetical protein